MRWPTWTGGRLCPAVPDPPRCGKRAQILERRRNEKRRETMPKRLIAVLALGAAAAVAAPAPAQAPAPYSLAAQRAKMARIVMHPNTAFLNPEERDVVNLLIRAADLMNPIYLRQMSADNPATRAAIARSR